MKVLRGQGANLESSKGFYRRNAKLKNYVVAAGSPGSPFGMPLAGWWSIWEATPGKLQWNSN